VSPLFWTGTWLNPRQVKIVKKLFGENDVEAVLQRLDRLTHDEGLAAAAQTFMVVHGLVQNMRAVIDGE
jgi:hypothetical protein